MSRILRLSEAASIAIHGMILVARSDKLVNVNQIAELTSSSRHHVAKVFQRLGKEDFINSSRGPSGGFSLKMAPADISFLDIYEAIEGKITITKCPLDKPICPFKKCIFKNVIKDLTLEFRNYMEEQTLDKFLDY
ncbi:MAG: Rrf2 family transcriptional regulator [Bacteroidales bacterium]|nr:Rrf2 family transcriptional regulator [Bacteroidales bacterium]